jgi:hypothetical protein
MLTFFLRISKKIARDNNDWDTPYCRSASGSEVLKQQQQQQQQQQQHQQQQQ